MSSSSTKVFGLFALCVALTGCAEKTWYKADGTTQSFGADKYACERDSRQSGYFGTGLIGALNMQDFYNRCMNTKGWNLQDKEKNQAIIADRKASIQAILVEAKTCVARVRTDPKYTSIIKYLPEDGTGHFSFSQMANTELPSSTDVATLTEYTSELDNCRHTLLGKVSSLLPAAKVQILQQRQTDSDTNTAELVRRQITYGEWATRENQSHDNMQTKLRGG